MINNTGKSIVIWIMAIAITGLLIFLIASWSGISSNALNIAKEAKATAIINSRDIAVISERLSGIEERLKRIELKVDDTHNVLLKIQKGA